MRRRGFLALLGISPVAAPVMLKDVAARTIPDLSLAPLGLAQEGLPAPASIGRPTTASALAMIKRLRGRSPDEHRFHRERVGVWALDPDLASYRSMSLGFRMALQRTRNYDRSLEENIGWWQAVVHGWLD